MNKEDKTPEDLLFQLEEGHQSSKEARGRRAKILRRMADLTRDQAAGLHKGLNVNTLKSWEIGRDSGLTIQGAQNLLELVYSKGVICSYEWLMYGIGEGPVLDPFIEKEVSISPNQISRQKQFVIDELRLFRFHHPEAVDFEIQDDGMGLHFGIHDQVAGIPLAGDDIETVMDQLCIVQLTNGKRYFRQIKKSKISHHYNLVCLNLDAKKVDQLVMETIELIYAAPVIWHRKLSQ